MSSSFSTSSPVRTALVLSLLVNVGVLAAVGWQTFQRDGLPLPSGAPTSLSRHLELSVVQLQRWHEAEALFFTHLHASGTAIKVHRDRLIEAIFSEALDPGLIERERAAVARLQAVQQRQVIEQLLLERKLLTGEQRQRLANLLIELPVGPSGFERLHRE
ncbi:MAG: periplasmic heavy metal sensor [Pseudomonas sp.]